MAILFPDRSPGGPNATSNDKNVHVKVVQLTSANFTTGGTASLVAVLAADATILGFELWKKTQLSGGGITAATISIGTPSAPTTFVNGFDAFTPAAGSDQKVTPATNIMQAYNVPLGPDIQVQVTGTATTGNPTAGEMYLKIFFVR